MDKEMKSSRDALRRRGKCEQADLDDLQYKSYEELLGMVDSSDPIKRTSAIHLLGASYRLKQELILKILSRLSIEKCLYTRIEICSILERGNADTARQMIAYLGKIGNNQHRKLPLAVSQKNAYPLPRDIIARTLGRMTSEVLPLFLDVLETDDEEKIVEIIDAIGFMVFYNKELGSSENLTYIIKVMDRFSDNQILIWKSLTCLSAFPMERSIRRLEEVRSNKEGSLFAKEASRSLKIIHKNSNRKTRM